MSKKEKLKAKLLDGKHDKIFDSPNFVPCFDNSDFPSAKVKAVIKSLTGRSKRCVKL